MKLLAAIACATAFGFSQTASATLLDRGNGMIYDDSTNLTWLQDANYAKTSGYTGSGVDSNGTMTWAAANTWATNLSFGGYDDWRLPTMTTHKAGFGRTDSELGYLFYVTLGNKGECDAGYISCPGVFDRPYGLLNKGPFTIQNGETLWSDIGTYDNYGNAWVFSTSLGFQGTTPLQGAYAVAWAIRDGDVAAVPEPASIALVGFGLLCLATIRRKSVD